MGPAPVGWVKPTRGEPSPTGRTHPTHSHTRPSLALTSIPFLSLARSGVASSYPRQLRPAPVASATVLMCKRTTTPSPTTLPKRFASSRLLWTHGPEPELGFQRPIRVLPRLRPQIYASGVFSMLARISAVCALAPLVTMAPPCCDSGQAAPHLQCCSCCRRDVH